MLGGNGFVGSRVAEALVARGVEVVSVSKSGKPANFAGSDKVTLTATDVLTADLTGTFSGADAVISCIVSACCLHVYMSTHVHVYTYVLEYTIMSVAYSSNQVY